MAFQIIRNDITKVRADVIVNSANPMPVYGRGTDSAIYAAAGAEELLREREKIGEIVPGEAAVTPAFRLDAKYIIHTVGPVWQDGSHGERETVLSVGSFQNGIVSRGLQGQLQQHADGFFVVYDQDRFLRHVISFCFIISPCPVYFNRYRGSFP